MRFRIEVFWDDEARVWVASSEDGLGLVAEAASLDTLIARIRELVPELAELNGLTPESETCPYDVIVHDQRRPPVRA